MNIQANPMHIYQQSGQSPIQNTHTAQHEATEQKKLSSAERPVQKTDSISLSNDARLLAEANRVAMQSSETDSSRTETIARLKAEVKNGTYQANERGIAEGLVREESHLFVV